MLSSNGPGRESTFSPTATTPLCTLILGHFAENHGEHYVCLEDQNYPEEVNNERRQAVSFGDFESNNSQDTFSGPVSGVPSEDETNQSWEDEQNLENCDHARDFGPNPENRDHAREFGPNTAYQPNAPSSSAGQYLNPDILEEIIRQTLRKYPYMLPSLRAVSIFFRNIVDREPLPIVYIPELNDLNDIRRVSVRKIMRLKGKNSCALFCGPPRG